MSIDATNTRTSWLASRSLLQAVEEQALFLGHTRVNAPTARIREAEPKAPPQSEKQRQARSDKVPFYRLSGLPILDCKFQIAIRADFPAANGELSILRRTFLNRQLAINNLKLP